MLLRQVDKKSTIHRYTALRTKPNSKNNLIFTPIPWAWLASSSGLPLRPPQQCRALASPGFSNLHLDCPSHLLSPFLCCPGGPSHPRGKTTALLIPLSPVFLTGPQQCNLLDSVSGPMPSGSQFLEQPCSPSSGPPSKPWSLLWRRTPPVSVSRTVAGAHRGVGGPNSARPPWPLLSRLHLCLQNVCVGLGSQAGRKESRSHKAKVGNLCQHEGMTLRGCSTGTLTLGESRKTQGASV